MRPDNLAITGKRGVPLIALNDATWLRLLKLVDMNMLQHVPNALIRCNMDKGVRMVLSAAADRALNEVLLPGEARAGKPGIDRVGSFMSIRNESALPAYDL